MANCTGHGNFRSTLRYFVCTLPEGPTVFYAALNTFLSITASLGNSLILIALHKVSVMHPPTELLFRCLAVTDLCVGVISQPLCVTYLLIAVTKINYHVLFYVDSVQHASSFILCGVSFFTSTAISVDRLLALTLGLRYRHVVTLRRYRVIIICFWIIGVAGVFLLFCSSRKIFFLVANVFAVLCVLISVVSFTNIFLKLRKHQAQIRDGHRGQANGGAIPLNIARYSKSVSSIAWVQLALVVCYLPFIISVIAIHINGWSGTTASTIWMSAITLLYLNSSLNPILYCWKIKERRREAKNMMRHFCCPSS